MGNGLSKRARATTRPIRASGLKARIDSSLLEKLKRVKLFLCDVDGVLTDASVYMGDEMEFKRFNIRDGLGLRILQKHGVQVGWISNRPSQATTQRALDLRIDYLSQDKSNKVKSAERILAKAGVSWEKVCYMGDDVVDLALLSRVGVAVAVASGIEETKLVADYTTVAGGGNGAVREMAELILKAQGKWKQIIAEFSENHS